MKDPGVGFPPQRNILLFRVKDGLLLSGALKGGGGPIMCWWSVRFGVAFGLTTPDR
jgi:hypothetical protein